MTIPANYRPPLDGLDVHIEMVGTDLHISWNPDDIVYETSRYIAPVSDGVPRHNQPHFSIRVYVRKNSHWTKRSNTRMGRGNRQKNRMMTYSQRRIFYYPSGHFTWRRNVYTKLLEILISTEQLASGHYVIYNFYDYAHKEVVKQWNKFKSRNWTNRSSFGRIEKILAGNEPPYLPIYVQLSTKSYLNNAYERPRKKTCYYTHNYSRQSNKIKIYL